MKISILRRSRVAIFTGIIKIVIIFVKTIFKDLKKLKESEIMYRNAIYICKICWFLVKKCLCQQNSEERVTWFTSFLDLLLLIITVPSFIIVGYVWQILGRWPFCPQPHPVQPQKVPSWIGLRYKYSLKQWEQPERNCRKL